MFLPARSTHTKMQPLEVETLESSSFYGCLRNLWIRSLRFEYLCSFDVSVLPSNSMCLLPKTNAQVFSLQ